MNIYSNRSFLILLLRRTRDRNNLKCCKHKKKWNLKREKQRKSNKDKFINYIKS